jgi:hypothetical protein
MDSAELGFRLRQEFGDWENGFDEEPVNEGFGRYGSYSLVGRGDVTDPNRCAKWFSFVGCLRVDLHSFVVVDGKSCEGKIFHHKVHGYCHKPSCPVCFRFGWAVREADMVESRLAEASKQFGEVEHIIVGVPVKDYRLELEVLRRKIVMDVLRPRGVVGGCLIFHGFRYANRDESRVKGVPFGWRWSPHFHVLGFIFGGYGKCRGCRRSRLDCLACSGFEGVTRRCNKRDGYIVKVKDKRKSVYHTAWYQLTHASLKVNVKRFHVVTWFGCCSYRKLKVFVKRRKAVCPLCGSPLVPLRYSGGRVHVFDKLSPEYVRDSIDNLCENGVVVWHVVDSGSYARYYGGLSSECRIY